MPWVEAEREKKEYGAKKRSKGREPNGIKLQERDRELKYVQWKEEDKTYERNGF